MITVRNLTCLSYLTDIKISTKNILFCSYNLDFYARPTLQLILYLLIPLSLETDCPLSMRNEAKQTMSMSLGTKNCTRSHTTKNKK